MRPRSVFAGLACFSPRSNWLAKKKVNVTISKLKKQNGGYGAHRIKKTEFQLTVGTFEHEFSESEVGRCESALGCPWRAKSCSWPKSCFWQHFQAKSRNHVKNVHIDVTFCVDPESAIRKCIGDRNLEKIVKVRFSFLGSQEVFSLRRKESYDQTEFRNGIYT